MSAEPTNSNEHLLRGVSSATLNSEQAAAFDAEQVINSLVEDPTVTQHLTRRRISNVDLLVGYFRCDFETTRERLVLHIPLVPPMDEIPAVEATVFDGELPARVRITDRHKFGIRLEVIRSDMLNRATRLLVEVSATSTIQGS